MARIARVVVPNVPHHVTQRGNRRQRTFFSQGDYELYKSLMAEWCSLCGVEVWAYCLMPNHTHMVLVPARVDALARAVGQAHRRYTWTVNRREGWSGYLWQGRFASFPMSERYLLAAVRYILLNPVRAGIVGTALEWAHSSAQAHLDGLADPLVDTKPLAHRVEDWRELLAPEQASADRNLFRLHQTTGRPMGEESFVSRVEALTRRRLRSQKRTEVLLQRKKEQRERPRSRSDSGRMGTQTILGPS